MQLTSQHELGWRTWVCWLAYWDRVAVFMLVETTPRGRYPAISARVCWLGCARTSMWTDPRASLQCGRWQGPRGEHALSLQHACASEPAQGLAASWWDNSYSTPGSASKVSPLGACTCSQVQPVTALPRSLGSPCKGSRCASKHPGAAAGL